MGSRNESANSCILSVDKQEIISKFVKHKFGSKIKIYCFFCFSIVLFFTIHHKDEDTSTESHITQIKTRPGGVAFEVSNNFYPVTNVAEIKVSRGGVAFEISTDHSPAAPAKSYVPPKISLPSPPITSMSCTRHAKEGVAFEIDFSDNVEEKRQLKTLSKVTSLMAADGWSERDVIKEADDVWVANKVLAMKVSGGIS